MQAGRTHGPSSEPLEALVAGIAATRAPGVAAAIIRADGATVVAAAGVADVAAGAWMTPDTILNIGSVSKLVTTTAVLQLVSARSCSLDADVGDLVGLRVRNPGHPGEPITVRHLLTHTSSLSDDHRYDESYRCSDPEALRPWLAAYFAASPPSGWADRRPGTACEYSNVGFGLLGLVVESVTGVPFRESTRRTILEPLGMASSGWWLADVDETRLATGYEPSASHEAMAASLLRPDVPAPAGWTATCRYGFPTVSDGLFRTSARDLARMAGAAARSELPGIDPGLLDDALRVQHPDVYPGESIGLGWWYYPSIRRPCLWGHQGTDPGIRAWLLVDRDAQTGAVLIANGRFGAWPVTAEELADLAAGAAAL